MKYSGGDINRLGERLRNIKGSHISDDDLDLLQAHRLSFTKPLFKVFKELTQQKSSIERSAIIAFRLKRITTIIDKVIREPKMELNRMWDMAGIRIIFENKKAAQKMLKVIQANYDVRGGIRDYFHSPKEIGYKAYHIYITEPESGKVIEIQLRTTETHNWATLVEITDVLYNIRLKEEGYDKKNDLARFHKILSSDREISPSEANFLYKTLDKYDFISKLADTFRKNSSEVKKQWQEVKHKDKYFLIELSYDSIPKLTSYSDYEKAESVYFNTYKRDEGALLVLTSLHKPTFEQISIAYANYIMSYHTFIKDVEKILKILAIEKLEDKKFNRFRKIFRVYENIQVNNLVNILVERPEVILNIKNKSIYLENSLNISSKKKKEVRNIIDSKLRQFRDQHHSFMNEIGNNLKRGPRWSWKTKYFMKRHSKRVNKRLKSIKMEF